MRHLISILLCCLCGTGCETPSSPFFEARVWQAETELKEKAQRLRQEGTTRRAAYLREHADLDPEIQQSMEEIVICVGMTKEQVRIAWGTPAVMVDHASEMWTYTGADWWDYMGLAVDPGPRDRVYVFFVNGSVTGWEYRPQ
jgi:hypothetical protein